MAKTRVGIRNGALFNQTSTLWNNLLAYYTGDNTPDDSLGNYNGTLVNGTTYGTGKINQGFSFDGVNDYVDLGNNLDFDGTTPFSISTWVKFDVLGNIEFLINKRDTTLSIRGYSLQKRNTNEIEFQLVNHAQGGQYRIAVYTSTQVTNNTFYHCVVTYDGSGNSNGVKIYLDGVSDTLVTRTNTLANKTISNSGNLWFGNLAYQNLPLNGLLDEVGIWDRVLTPSEVTELYNSGSGKQYTPPVVSTPSIITDGLVLNLDAGNTLSYPGTGTDWFDLTSNDNDGVLLNGASYITDGGGSISFDGVNDFVDCGNDISFDITQTLTLECWVKKSTKGGYHHLISKFPGGNCSYLLGTNTNGQPYFSRSTTGSNQGINGTYNSNISDDNWYHVVASYNSLSSTLIMSVNGVAQTFSLSGDIHVSTTNVNIAKRTNVGQYFPANIPVARIYNNALTETQIQQNYNATKGRFGL